MSSQPKTHPETWVPAGTEKRDPEPKPPGEPQAERRKPRVAMPPPVEKPRAPRLKRARAHMVNLLWAALAAGVPWLWFLVRDLGSVTQLVALALPVLVLAAFVGLAISALDERKLSSLLVAVSVAGFGWVTILGPRSALPAPPPIDPIRIASITLDGSTLDSSAIVGSIARQRADIAVVVEPSKKARAVLLRADRFPYTLTSGQFVVLSSIPVSELPLPKGLPSDLVVRLQVDRLDGSFIVYAVRAGTSPLDAAQNDPIGVDRLRNAARNERLPVVLAGDFGIADRSREYRTLTDSFRDAMRSGSRAATTASTFPWSFLFVRTVYVLTSPDWCAGAGSTFDVADAPTVGVTAAVGLCRH
jgi:endonuclease/exonuclease/phosphatase (EEP) superfamily protein YafD